MASFYFCTIIKMDINKLTWSIVMTLVPCPTELIRLAPGLVCAIELIKLILGLVWPMELMRLAPGLVCPMEEMEMRLSDVVVSWGTLVMWLVGMLVMWLVGTLVMWLVGVVCRRSTAVGSIVDATVSTSTLRLNYLRFVL